MAPIDTWLRRFQYGRRPSAWAAVSQQMAWEARSLVSSRAPVPLTWPIPDDIAPRLTVLWPRQYSWKNAPRWVGPIRRGIGQHIAVRTADITQEPGNIVHLLFTDGDSILEVGIDYDDPSDLHSSAPSLDLYFKLQYRRGGYEYSHVVPGSYVSGKAAVYKHVDRWREWRENQQDHFEVLGRFGLYPEAEIRRAILQRMNGQRRFSFEGGAARTTSWEHMQDLCRSKVCLDAPGRGELCFRLVECLAIGSCIVGPALGNELHVPLRDGTHNVRVNRDLSDLVETCEELLENPDKRAKLKTAATDYFDRYLRLEQIGGYYVNQCVRALGNK
jgi:Glycosyl transferases group 1